MKSRHFVLFLAVSLVLACAAICAAGEEKTDSKSAETRHTRYVIYPILAQVPIFGADVKLPPTNSGGEGGSGEPGVSGSTEGTFNSAFLAGVSIERPRWLLDFEPEYAGLTAERSNPLTKVKTKFLYFSLVGGWRFSDQFAVTGGVKHVALDIDVTFPDDTKAHTKPGVWDPMIGIDWRRLVSRKLWLNANLQGGGFGVGTDVDISARVAADWEFLPHVLLDVGYSLFHYKATIDDVTVNSVPRELVTKQTLHGPRIGIGVTF